jgi:hypothetical protein
MLNSKPNNKNYNSGNYIPINKEKVIKLNNEGGLYYRSSWEKRVMIWLDNKKEIIRWGAECISVPYQITEVKRGLLGVSTKTYFPDFYYEIKTDEGIQKVVLEVKPDKEYQDAVLFSEGKFSVPDNITLKKLQGLEYRFKMAQKNSEKWQNVIKWCEKRGYQFVIMTENQLNNIS